jgi:hypothetical protein
MADDATPARDYRETVFLPDTPFPMRAGLPKLEPEILARWDAADLYKAIRARRQADGAHSRRMREPVVNLPAIYGGKGAFPAESETRPP